MLIGTLAAFVRSRLCGVGIAVMVTAVPTSAIQPAGSPTATLALEKCAAIDDRPAPAAADDLARYLDMAERAVAADPNDAKAHFAVFCNLAKQTYLRGFNPLSLFAVRRLHREIDATLRIAPDYTDALVAKGAFLLNLPRLLGGDADEAVRVLRHALDIEPERISAHLHLAEALTRLGAKEAALYEAQHALQAALRSGREPEAEKARILMVQLQR